MKELSKKLSYNNKESKVFMPNEIFDDLQSHLEKGVHIPFSYSYIYLCTWLYRHTKHFNPNIYDNNVLKECLGFNPKTQEINYLIKKNGLLDEIGYLESVRDFPISWEIVDGELHFDMYSDYPEFPAKMSNRFFLKKPVFAFERVDLDDSNYVMEGTFYNITNTHMIPFEVFLFCMSKKELGVSAFYLYSYLKYKCDTNHGSYTVSIHSISEQVKMSLTTTKKYISLLKSYKMVDFHHNQEYFVAGANKEDRKPNTYITRNPSQFSSEKIDYKKIRMLSREEYDKIVQDRVNLEEEISNNLPF